MVDRHKPQLIEIRGLPQLFSDFENVPAISRLQRFTWYPHVFP